MPQTLEQLLRDADATRMTPHPALAIAQAVRIRHRRRVSTRRLVAAASLSFCVSLLAYNLAKPLPSVVITKPLAMQLNEHDFVDVHELTADLLTAARPRPRPAVVTATNPESDIQFQRDRAALILVYEADRHAREKRPTAALASYRRAIELFPQTHWADVARQRVKEMQS